MTVMRKAFVFVLGALPSVSIAADEFTLHRYKEVIGKAPDMKDKNVRVWNLRKNETIRINMVEFSGELPLHKHPDGDHTLLVLEGKVRVQIADRKFEVEKGDFISIPKDVPHKYWTLSGKAMLVSMDAPYYDPKKTIRLEQ